VIRLLLLAAGVVGLCFLWALVAVLTWTFQWEYATYETFGQSGTLLQAVVGAVDTPLPGAFLQGKGGALRPLGDLRFGYGNATLCELYVEVKTGSGNQGVTAYAAAERLAGLGLLHQGTPPAGSLVYFGPSPDNDNDGHVGIALGGGQFRSVTVAGVADAPLAGWRAPFLGWAAPADVTTDRFGSPVHGHAAA